MPSAFHFRLGFLSRRSLSVVLMAGLLVTGTTPVAAERESGSVAPQVTEAPVILPVGATLQGDIAYGPDPRQRFDAYLPVATEELAPIIFMVHGGAWRLGDKALANTVDDKVTRWVSRGFVFISVNYRMLPDADPMQQAEDVVRALAYVQQHAGDYNADPSRIILMGHSAGAHLVSLISTHPTLAGSQGVVPWLGTVSLDSAAYDVAYIMVRPHLPLYDEAFGTDPVFWAAVSPYQVLVQPVPPILAVCSSQRTDSQVQAARFAARAQVIGTSVDVLTKDYTHEEINEKLGEPGAYTDEVEAFLRTLDSVVAARLVVIIPPDSAIIAITVE
jgi:arylformamidase